ncbi:MAG: GH3 auxin-responsive promoter family protein [Ruminiclostridium sp.]|nr:GH3 auxin-responsive promoter family protein [Ruminiclostridium sp.]MBQ9933541.1 GH3 auxin-responsive promoter family protein [Ruminiclostridium sp.]
MRFQEKLHEYSKEEIWEEYCGFLTLSTEEFMDIQKRLLLEQMELWSSSALGQSILKGQKPTTIEEFREMVPLTTYEDYAPILLSKQTKALPGEPVLWVQTTWEGGVHPIKVAPYTKAILDTFQHNVMSCLLLATSKEKGEFDVSVTDHMLYALAPLPFVTGLLPLLFHEEIDIEFLPPVKDAVNMTFKERNVQGFKQGMKKGIEYFFGLGSVLYYVSQSVTSMSSGGKKKLMEKLFSVSPAMLFRLMMAKRKCKKEQRELLPKDLFKLKGFMCAGTDNRCYKADLEEMWGVSPMEVFAGTEPTCIGCETWSREGVYFFPDACFYEFIPEDEMNRNLEDPDYKPRTVLWDEVVPGGVYEIVLTVFKGGAFARYRVGDVFRCSGIGSRLENNNIPRFQYVDRTPEIIDIAGFTRITEKSINQAIELSRLPIEAWTAKKEFTENNRPYMHLYVELQRNHLINTAVSTRILHDQLGIYFQYLDQDYEDLKKILGVDPLKITMIKCGTFEAYERKFGGTIRTMNPESCDINDLLACHQFDCLERRGGMDDWI